MTKFVRRQGRYLAFGLLLLLFLLSACAGQPGTTASTSKPTPTPTPTPKPKDPVTLLNDTQSAMQAVQLEHQIVKMTAGGDALAALTASNPSSSVDMSKASLDMKIESDIQKPNQSSGTLYLNVSLGTMQVTYNLKQVDKDNQTYVQSSKGVWYVIDPQAANNPSANPFVSFTKVADFDGMASSFQKGKVTDNGYNTVNGVRLRHLTSTLDQGAVGSQLGTSSLTNLDTAAIDIWIDEATGYTYKIDFKLTFKATATTTQTYAFGADTGPTLDIELDYSNFNQPVTITAPQGAVPADSFTAALQ